MLFDFKPIAQATWWILTALSLGVFPCFLLFSESLLRMIFHFVCSRRSPPSFCFEVEGYEKPSNHRDLAKDYAYGALVWSIGLIPIVGLYLFFKYVTRVPFAEKNLSMYWILAIGAKFYITHEYFCCQSTRFFKFFVPKPAETPLEDFVIDDDEDDASSIELENSRL